PPGAVPSRSATRSAVGREGGAPRRRGGRERPRMPGITDVPGIRVGHATDAEAATGCTVVLGPFRAACDVRGLATGTREIETLSPLHLVPRADAILLTGGSADRKSVV